MAGVSCSTLLTKAEFETYKLATEQRFQKIENALSKKLGKDEKSTVTIAATSEEFNLDEWLKTAAVLGGAAGAKVVADNAAKAKVKIENLEPKIPPLEKDVATAAKEAKKANDLAENIGKETNRIRKIAEDAAGAAKKALSNTLELFGKIAGILSVIDLIFSLINFAAFDLAIKNAQRTAEEAWSIANKAFTEAGSAKWQARNASERADAAINKSNQAIQEANRANNKASDAINKADTADTKAQNAINQANTATSKVEEVLAETNKIKSQVEDLKSQVRSLHGGIEKVKNDLENLAATQSIQSVKLNQALNELSSLETLVAVLEGEIEGLEALLESSSLSQINQLRSLIQSVGGTAQQAFDLAQKAIQLAANNGGGEGVARLQSQLQQLKTSFDGQINSIATQVGQQQQQISQLNQQQGEQTKQIENLKQNTPEQTKLSQQQAEQVKQIAEKEIELKTPEIVKKNSMTPQEFEKLQTSSNEKLINFLVPALTIALLPQLLPKLDSINKNTQDIKNKPTKDCLAPIYVPPVGQKVDRNITATTALHSYTAVQTTAIKADTTSINVQTTQVNAKTSAIQTIASNTLNKVGEVASSITKLYRFLGIDRWINYVNMALLLHNALMLSNNLGQTAISAVENVFQLFGLKLQDDKGQEIDLSTLVGKTIQDTAKAVLGNENYTVMTTTWKKANRIYQTGMNVLYSVQSIGNSIQNLTQLAIENTGKIGNALRKAGAVFENAYAPMVEKVTAMTPFQRGLQSYTDTIQGSDTAISNMDQVTGEVTSMKDAKKELFGDGTPENKGQIKEFEDTVKTKSDEKKVEEDVAKSVSQSPDIARSDLIKPES